MMKTFWKKGLLAKLLIILLWPLTLTYLVWTHKKIPNLLKFVLISFIWVCAIGLVSYQSDNRGISNTEPTKSIANITSPPLQESTQTPSVEKVQLTSQPLILDTEQTVNEQETSRCKLKGYLPDPKCNIGTTDPRVTQDNINSTICVSGYTTTVRPSTSYTHNLKVQGIKDYGYTVTDLSYYEEDHIIPLEVGGSPTDPQNLFPEPIQQAKEKDKVENYLHARVCGGSMTLSEAQTEIVTDWHAVYVNVNLGAYSLNPNLNNNVSTDVPITNTGVVKMSTTGICHAPNTTYYDRTTNYKSYATLQDCLNAGGRLPKR